MRGCNTGKARVCRKDDISNILFLTGASLPLNGTGTFTAFARQRILSLELVPSALLPVALANNGMPGSPFRKGLNNLRYREEVIARTKRAIDECVEFGISNVIASPVTNGRMPRIRRAAKPHANRVL